MESENENINKQIEYPPDDIEIDDFNARLFFQKSALSKNVIFDEGRILVKSHGFWIKTAYKIRGVCLFFALLLFFNRVSNTIIDDIILILNLIAFFIFSYIRTFAVFDYKNKTIYTQTFCFRIPIYKSKCINFDAILQVAIDYRPFNISLLNIKEFFFPSEPNDVTGNLGDSAVAVLLKNGNIYQVTGFVINRIKTYKDFAEEMARVLKVGYKQNPIKHYLYVRRGKTFCLESHFFDEMSEIGQKDLSESILDITIGVLTFIAGFIAFMYVVAL